MIDDRFIVPEAKCQWTGVVLSRVTIVSLAKEIAAIFNDNNEYFIRYRRKPQQQRDCIWNALVTEVKENSFSVKMIPNNLGV